MGSPQGFSTSFFKVMVGDFSTQVQIPPRFIKNFGKRVPRVPRRITLKVQVSFNKSWDWEVEVERNEKNFFLKTGWERFVEEINLEEADFLTFEKSANSTFNVKIYDLSGCEKELSLKPSTGKRIQEQTQDQRKRKLAEVKDEQSLEANGNFIEDETLKDDKKVVLLDSESDDDDDRKTDDLKQPRKKRMQARASQHKSSSIQNNGRSTSGSTKRKTNFSSENPFFELKLPQSYGEGKYLNVPAEFFRRYLPTKKETQEVTLKVSDKSWTFNLRMSSKSGCVGAPGTTCRISTGWREFVMGNGLTEDDACVFEMISSNEIVFKVHIYRKHANQQCAGIYTVCDAK